MLFIFPTLKQNMTQISDPHKQGTSRFFLYFVEFDETPRFWYPRVALDAWTDFAFPSTKTYGPISVNLREKLKLLTPHLSSPSSVSPPCLSSKMWPFFHLTFLFPSLIFFSFFLNSFIFIYFLFFLNLDTWLTLRHVSITHSSMFLPRNNLFFFSSIDFN